MEVLAGGERDDPGAAVAIDEFFIHIFYFDKMFNATHTRTVALRYPWEDFTSGDVKVDGAEPTHVDSVGLSHGTRVSSSVFYVLMPLLHVFSCALESFLSTGNN